MVPENIGRLASNRMPASSWLSRTPIDSTVTMVAQAAGAIR